MRADMGKVLVERPRLGGWRGASRPGKGYAKRLRKYFDAGDSPPACEGIKARYGHRTKFFNEHLGPLRRFLASNVGRPWDKVYSEICKHVDRGNVVQKHILTHLFEYVVVHTVMIDRQPCRSEGRRFGEPLRTSDRRDRWYVCPKSGLLRRSKYVPFQRNQTNPPRQLRLNNKQLCALRNGRWELITIALVEHSQPDVKPEYSQVLMDEVCDCRAVDGIVIRRLGGNTYSVTRRVLSKKELLALPIPIEWLP
jgi:hypothetical protein